MDPEIVNEIVVQSDINLGILAMRFGINLLAVIVIVRLIYYPIHRNKDFVFTFFLFNIINFLLCYLLGSAQLKLGFAFGLFAIFSIIRYRTVTIPVREMGYFFLCVTLGIINALASLDQIWWLLIPVNLVFIIIVFVLDSQVKLSHENNKEIVYDNISLIHPAKRQELINDLNNRTGLNIHRIDVAKIDYFKETAVIKAHYFADRNETVDSNYSSSNEITS